MKDVSKHNVTATLRGTARSNEQGAALVIGLMFLAILALVGGTAVLLTTTDIKIGGNYKTNVQAASVAQAGVDEALYRLGLFDDGGTAAPPSGSMININNLTDNNAAINIDPNGLLDNGVDDDGNGAVDDISDLNYNGSYDNRNWQAKIMLSNSAPAGLVGNTTFYTNTIQPSSNWMEYSSPTDDGTALTIHFLKDTNDMDGDGNTSEIVFYDLNRATPMHVDTAAAPASGQPLVVIESTGKSGGSVGKLQVVVSHHPIDIKAEAAVMVDMAPTFTGNSLISGFNYDGTVSKAAKPTNRNFWGATTQFYQNGVDNHGGDEKMDWPGPNTPYSDNDTALIGPTAAPNNEEELGDNKYPEEYVPYTAFLENSGHKPGVWTTAAANPAAPPISPGATNDVFGGSGATGTTPWKTEGAPAWKTLAELLGVSQATLDKILAGANVTVADMDVSGQLGVAPQGVIYIDNAGGTEVKVTSSTPDCDNGWGLMYVTGDAQFQDVGFKGLIYVEGDAHIAAGYWMCGCLAVKGTTSGDFTAGGAHFLYSADVLSSYVNRGMKFVPLSWKNEGTS